MTERLFVDTNVLVYLYDSGEPGKQVIAAQWLQRLWRDRSGRTSIQVLNELYVTLSRKLARRMSSEETWDVVNALMEWDPQPIDRDLLRRAREVERRYRLSWWDSLIVASAQLQDCDVLLTEDLQQGMSFDGVTVQNPFRAKVQEMPVAYAIALELPPRHRRRGRPRKQRVAGSPT